MNENAMISVGIVGYVFLLCWIVAHEVAEPPSKPSVTVAPSFCFLDRVRVVDGFYTGQIGSLKLVGPRRDGVEPLYWLSTDSGEFVEVMESEIQPIIFGEPAAERPGGDVTIAEPVEKSLRIASEQDAGQLP